MKYHFTLALTLTLVACGAAPETLSINSSSNSNPVYKPEHAGVRFKSSVTLVPASEESTLLVPSLSMVFRSASYAQILRCQIYSPYQDISGLSREDKKWKWFEASQDSNNCKIVSTHLVRGQFQDVSAPSGEFYYLVNPCVDAASSATGKDECSFLLEVSTSIKQENALNSKFAKLAENLSLKESALSTSYSSLYKTTEFVRTLTDKCESEYATSESKKRFWTGIKELTLTGVGALIGAVVTGGPGAIAGAKIGLAAAIKIFGDAEKTPFNCTGLNELVAKGKKLSVTSSQIEKEILKLRNEMSQVETTYAKIDNSLLDEE